jgi:hypothetical protein
MDAAGEDYQLGPLYIILPLYHHLPDWQQLLRLAEDD